MNLRIPTAFLTWLFPAALVAAPAPRVILISVDGLPAAYFAEPRVDMPTLRALAGTGARAERMIPVFPTVTWPNHTSLVTGVVPARHGVLGNAYWDRAAHEEVAMLHDPLLDKEQLVKGLTIYDAAHLAGLTTAAICWPATRNARNLDWQVPFVTATALYRRYTTPELLTYLDSLGVDPRKIEEWSKDNLGGKMLWDWINTRLAKHVLLTHRPNLLLLHLDAVDSVEHRNGRDSAEAYWACRAADDSIRELVEAVRKAGLTGETTFLVVSDHGFQNYTHLINLGAVLQAARLEQPGRPKTESRAAFVSASGSAGIYILDEANRAAIAKDLVTRLKGVPGIARVLTGDAMVAAGLPLTSTDGRAADLIVTAANGYAFGRDGGVLPLITPVGAVKGAHGYPADEPNMGSTFIAWGAAIKGPMVLPEVHTVDVAPTIAAVLDVPLPDTDGRALREILR